jgi:hypothetical protein
MASAGKRRADCAPPLIADVRPHTMTDRPYCSTESSDAVRCPCCRFRTLVEAAAYEICPVCYWEDDGQGDDDADIVRGGPNGTLSLEVARQNFRTIGASHQQAIPHVREPKPEEA